MSSSTDDNNVYGRQLSEVYDLVYLGRGRDYAAEAAVVARAVHTRRPGATSLLDVACGTGEHLASLAAAFSHVEGVELSAEMCERAQAKLPRVAIHPGDMRDFSLGRTFDAVVCLFSSISYMTTTDDLDKAVATMAAHLPSGGILVIDPWFSPDRFIDGYVSDVVVRERGVTVARVSHSRRSGRSVRQEAHFVVADTNGIDHFTTVQRMTLFTRAEYTAALERAGCTPEYLEGPDAMAPDRGMYIGTRK